MSMRYEMVKYRILKIGRKWIEGEVPEKGWRAKIEINDVSRDWKVGDVVRFPASVDIERSKYGTKVTVHPISEEKWEEMQTSELKKEYKELKEKIDDAREEGWYAKKSAERISAIAEKLGIREETEQWLDEVKKEVEHRKAVDHYNKLADKIMGLGGGDRYSYFESLMGEIREIAQTHEDIKEQFERDLPIFEKKEKEIKRESLRARFNRICEIAENMIDEKMVISESYLDSMMSMLKEAREEGFEDLTEEMDTKMSMLVLKVEEKEREIDEWYDADTLRMLREVGATNQQLFLLIKRGLVKKGERYMVEDCNLKFNNPEMRKMFTELYRMLMKEEGGFVVQNALVIPEEKHALAEKLKEALTEDRVWEILQTIKRDEEPHTDEEIEDLLPRTWNHLKREYVAVLHPDLSLEFISRPTNFTRSGANADLEWTLPTETGTILVERSGSHRHKPTAMYRRDRDGWKYLGASESGLYALIKEIVTEHLVIPIKGEDIQVVKEGETFDMEIE